MVTIHRLTSYLAPAARASGPALDSVTHRLVASGYVGLSRFGATFALWQDRARERKQLASLDDRLLRDIGLDRAAVAREASKPFWRA